MRSNVQVTPTRVPLIVIPCLNEASHVRKIAEIMARAVVPFGGRVVIVDGGSTDGTVSIATDLAEQSQVISLLGNAAKIQSCGVNAAVAAFGSGCTDLIRIDAHGAYPDDYVSTLLEEAALTQAASVVVSMRASGDSALQRVNAATQNSSIGNGGSLHRSRSSGQFVDHGHHALMRLDAFRAVGGYDPSFSHNEDAELDYRLGKAGYKIWLTNRTEVIYFPRRDMPAIARQYFNYGRGRAQNLQKHRALPNPRQSIMIAVAPIVATATLFPAHVAFSVPALLWAAAALAGGLRLALFKRSPLYLMAGPIALVMHLCWSLGFWSILFTRRVAVERPEPS